MIRRALVLGGGGILGIAWEIGVIKALRDAGLDVADADLVVGTSAGSVVGTRLAQGTPIEALVAEQGAPPDGKVDEALAKADLARVMALFQRWASYETMTQETCAEVGAMALAAQTASEAEWLEWFESQIGGSWPERDLRVTAVDAESGEFRAWSRADGVDVRRAVASSCAVPGLFPCVTINGRRYQDGGVRSGTCAWLASGYDSVLIIAPIGSGTTGIDPLLGRMTMREAEELRAGGSEAELVFPDAATLDVFGINRMDNSKRQQALEAGMEQGRSLAASIAPAWTRAPA